MYRSPEPVPSPKGRGKSYQGRRERQRQALREVVREANRRMFPDAQSTLTMGTLTHSTMALGDKADPEIDAPEMVQNHPRRAGAMRHPRKWKWTKRKKAVLRWTLGGLRIGQIAEKAGVHRNVIRRWWRQPEFRDEVRQRLEEERTSARGRALHRTGLLAGVVLQSLRRAAQGWRREGQAQRAPSAARLRASEELARRGNSNCGWPTHPEAVSLLPPIPGDDAQMGGKSLPPQIYA